MSLEPIRPDEFSVAEWFEIARKEEPGLTWQQFSARWPAFKRWLSSMERLGTRH